MNRKILLLGLSLILLILPISTSTPVRAQQMYPPPMVAGITPSSGEQGQTLDLIISGHYFQDGASVSFSPPIGITINSLTTISAMELRANINIDPNAPLLPRDVTVTNPDAQYATLEDGFTVKAKGCTDLYLAYVNAQQAASEACLTYDLLKIAAKSKINDAEKTVNDKEKALQACLDEAEKKLEELAKEKDKLEKEIAELEQLKPAIIEKQKALQEEVNFWYQQMEETRHELALEGATAFTTGILKVSFIPFFIATGPVGLVGAIIGGALEIASALKTQSDLKYYTEQYNDAIRALNEASTQILQLVKQLESKQAELASLSEKISQLEKACEKEQTAFNEANATLKVLEADFEEKLKKAEKECNEATKKKAEAEAEYDACLKALTAE